jgi:hypothetical protein
MPTEKSVKKRTSNTMNERKWGPLITQLVISGRNAHSRLRSSRRFRRGLQDLKLGKNKKTIRKKVGELSLLFSIRPDLLSWWIGTLFMVGSSFFIAGSIMLLFFSDHFTSFVINLTYFIGSIFFTSAAYGQFLQAINANIALLSSIREKQQQWRWWARGLRSPGFLSAAAQFIGTLFFNLNTFSALYGPHTSVGENLFIWVPDVGGSILFLVSSFFAWIEIYHDDFVKPLVTATWWVVWLNIIGSVFFQISAFYGYISPMTGMVANSDLAVYYTLWGAVCFYLGAHLSNVEIREIGKRT